jgi:lysocardiolipin and lysophospholipid acyltransferase
MVLFAPSSITLTSDQPPSLPSLIERDAKTGKVIRLNLPDRLVVVSNHQAYLDWMYIWILAAYAGHAKGVIILLKYSLRGIPMIGWGMVSIQ